MERPSTTIGKIAFFLVCAVVIVTILAYGTVHQPIIALFYLFVTVLVLLMATDALLTKSVQVSISGLQLPLLLFGVYGLVQIVPFGTSTGGVSGLSYPRTISIEPFATEATALHIFALSAFLAVTLSVIDREKRLRKIVTTLAIFGFVYAFFSILQSVLSPGKIYGIYEPAIATPFGSFVNRHNFAAIMEMLICLPLALVFTGAVDRDKRLLYWIAAALMGTAVLLSGSRGGLAAMFAGIFFLAFLAVRQKGSNPILSVGLVGAVILLTLAGAIFVGGDTSLTRINEATGSGVSASRLHIWGTTLRIIGDNFPLGTGLGAYGQAYTQFDTTGGFHRVDQAHNDYLQVLSDAGIVGLLLGGAFLYLFFREGFRNVRLADPYRRGVAIGAFAGCFAVLVHSLFDFVLHTTAMSVTFLTLLAILISSGRLFTDKQGGQQKRRLKSTASVTDLSHRIAKRCSS